MNKSDKIITHEELIKIGFKLRGVEEKDPFYQITFVFPFRFGIQQQAGFLKENGIFWFYGNNQKYNDINELTKVITVLGQVKI